jgi:glycogen synthase
MENHEEQTRDGFTLTRKVYVPTHDTSMLDPVSKRKATICNLFVTHRMSLKEIARVLDEEYVRIIQVIIDSGLVYDRRKQRQVLIPNERRKAFFKKA